MLLKGLLKLTLLLIVMALVPLLAFATVDNKEQEETPEQVLRYTRQVCLIVIDGLQGDVLQKVQAPNINGVASAGVRVAEAVPVLPATLRASAGTILTGTDPLLHRFQKDGDRLAEPTILELLAQRKVGTAFFDGSGGQLKALAQGARSYYSADSDEEVLRAALRYMKEKKPYLSVIVLGEPGKALAASGAGSREYSRAVSQADNHVGELLRFLHQQGLYDEAMLIISGTSGAPPLIMKGLQFKGGVILPPVGLIDVAPTLAYVLGIRLPETAGLVLWNAMEPGSFQNGFYLMEQRIKDLSHAQVTAYKEIYRLRNEQHMVDNEKARLTAEKGETTRAISERDREIRSLGLKMKVLIGAVFVLLVVFGLGYLWEYRYLKRKFLLFP